MRGITAEALVRCGHPQLEHLARLDVAEWRRRESRDRRGLITLLSKALVQLGVAAEPVHAVEAGAPAAVRVARDTEVSARWLEWVYRWEATSTLASRIRASVRNALLKVGRWVSETAPDMSSPERWDRRLAASAVAAVNGMRVGDYTSRTNSHLALHAGKPLSPRAKVQVIQALRVFFQDAQEWEWIARRFNPVRAFAVPKSISSLIAPDPRTIPDDIWAKLVWAGLNLNATDLPRYGRQARGRDEAERDNAGLQTTRASLLPDNLSAGGRPRPASKSRVSERVGP